PPGHEISRSVVKPALSVAVVARSVAVRPRDAMGSDREHGGDRGGSDGDEARRPERGAPGAAAVAHAVPPGPRAAPAPPAAAPGLRPRRARRELAGEALSCCGCLAPAAGARVAAPHDRDGRGR